ncbi:BtrH N-terminal domain-containing protein [Perlucidibaca piscinae]|jgi:hypothetical protein|uniref:BtrH N-terminal domain-containing protein n=1 Tax=Perlucidibaca piscinae TaxID=392589 RepID=UPI0003B525D4|nr:BtrH N-terminal domain-containing protein [Perlucidibaca piscinae]
MGVVEQSPGTVALPAQRHSHRPGRHCGSSAIRDLLEFHGLTMTEACCFGLGAGLGITYVEVPGSATPFIVHVRSMGFEEKVFATLGVPFAWEAFAEKDQASDALNEALLGGRPALLLTDIYHLPYFNSSTHFPGHAIVAWQLDAQRSEVMVSDTERPGLMPVPVDKLADSRFSTSAPFVHYGNMYAPQHIDAEVSPSSMRRAIVDNAASLMRGNRHSGLAALDTWIAELSRWAADPNWRWNLRFAYQVIEKRGTGGSGFRAMYIEFLEEAREQLPQVRRGGLLEKMRASAAAWSGLAAVLKAGSEADAFPYSKIEAAIRQVRIHEQCYADSALSVFPES